jgi:acyl-CoA synthetase (AMP-forming)/AMP-acid ligase II
MRISQTLRRSVQQHPDENATVYKERKQSWREFEDRVARLASGIRTLGIERGSRVAILSLNSDRYLEYFYAVSWAGGGAESHQYPARATGNRLLSE